MWYGSATCFIEWTALHALRAIQDTTLSATAAVMAPILRWQLTSPPAALHAMLMQQM